METSRVRRAAVQIAAWASVASVVATTCALLVLNGELSRLGRSDLYDPWLDAVFLLGEASSCAVGALLLLRRQGHPVGAAFALLAVTIGIDGAAARYALVGLVADRAHALPAAAEVAAVESSLYVWWLLAIGVVGYLTPTGDCTSASWRWCLKGLGLSAAAWFGLLLVSPGPLPAPFRSIRNPLGLTGLQPVRDVLLSLLSVSTTVLVLLSFVSLAVRYHRADGELHRQLLWMGLAVVPVPICVVVAFVAAKTDDDTWLAVGAGGFAVVLPVAAGLSVMKTRLYDVDRILSRAVTYALLTLLVGSTYLVVVLVVGQGLGGVTGSSAVKVSAATLVAAGLIRPGHQALQDAVDRRFFRRRFDAVGLLQAHVATPRPDVSVEEVLRRALQDPALEVAYWNENAGTWVTSDGRAASPAGADLRVVRAGRTIAAVRTTSTEQELVDAVLREAEPELDNTGLRAAVALQLEQVRASRARLAAAQLDERRRVERDLHDGAQQRLLGLAAQLQAALLNGTPERAAEALEAGVRESRAAVGELRQLAHGLHPAALTLGGIPAMLDDLAMRHPVVTQVDDPARRYPREIEATVWFIACEAVSNAVKHAEADSIAVCVQSDDSHVRVSIRDDGTGGADPAGTGLRGLADRAEAVGGRLLVTDLHPQGTAIEAVLPCGS